MNKRNIVMKLLSNKQARRLLVKLLKNPRVQRAIVRQVSRQLRRG